MYRNGLLHHALNFYNSKPPSAASQSSVQVITHVALSGSKAKEVDRSINYLSDRRHMIRYPEFIAKGWQIGSGPMESQCRMLSDRVRGSGMRWDADNAEVVMALEAMEQSNQWPQYWKIAMLHNN